MSYHQRAITNEPCHPTSHVAISVTEPAAARETPRLFFSPNGRLINQGPLFYAGSTPCHPQNRLFCYHCSATTTITPLRAGCISSCTQRTILHTTYYLAHK